MANTFPSPSYPIMSSPTMPESANSANVGIPIASAPAPAADSTPTQQNRSSCSCTCVCSWSAVTNFLVKMFVFLAPWIGVLYAAYAFWLGGTAASITIESRNASNGIQNIKQFPGQFYRYMQSIAAFGIIGGIALVVMLAIILGRRCQNMDNKTQYVIVYGIICFVGAALFIAATVIYANFKDLGRDFVERQYDIYDSRYSSFIAAQLYTLIVNALPMLVTTVFVVAFVVMKISEECC